MKSISRQLSVGLIGSLLVVGLVLGQSAFWLLDKALRDYMARSLHEEAQSVLAAIQRGPNGLQLDPARLDPTYQRPLSGRYFEVSIGAERWRSRSLWDAELPAGAGAALLHDGPKAQQLLVLREDYRRYGQPVGIVVATDYAPVLAAFQRIGLLLLALWVLALAVLIALQRLWTRRALRPLEAAREQIEQLQRGQRGALDEVAAVELQPLVREINRLLKHTRDSLARSRNALGNLGHALKTPLAVLSNLVEREGIDTALRPQLHDQLEQMRQRISRELNRARTAGEALPGSLFEPAQDLPLLVATLRQAHARALDIDWREPGAGALPWDRDDMLELLGNLLDNACKWARERVVLEIAAETKRLIIAVADDGPGIDAQARPQALARGGRLDEQADGHGLGLAIVGDIVDAYNGSIELRNAALGGLQVWIELPWPD